jgi:23S rRNA (uracil1939-C5)-methyltransferase
MPTGKRPNKPGTPRPKRDGRSDSTSKKGSAGSKPSANKSKPPATTSKPPARQTARPEPVRYAPDTFEIKLNAMAHGGYAIGPHNRRATFIPYAIPGEVLRARIVNTQGAVDFAQGVALLDASADRVYPRCQHFGPGRCWGCQWQHIDYGAQLLLKQDVLVDQLYRVGHFSDEVLERAIRPAVASPQQWEYATHITFERERSGSFGLHRIDGRTIEPITRCHLIHPDLLALYETLDIDFANIRRLSLWRGSNAETMIVLVLDNEDVPQLNADFPTSVNVLLPDNEPVNLVGDSAVTFDVHGRSLRMTAGGWFRANLAQLNNLIDTVLGMLRLTADDAVLDLYAGVGVFSAFMAEYAGLVTMVESYPPMVTDAEENLRDFEHVDIIEGAVEDILDVLIEQQENYQAVVLDPPAGGLSRKVIDGLLTLNIPRIVYISSDPASLARDGQQLLKAGYHLEQIQPFDFAPQTYYIDAALLFVK